MSGFNMLSVFRSSLKKQSRESNYTQARNRERNLDRTRDNRHLQQVFAREHFERILELGNT